MMTMDSVYSAYESISRKGENFKVFIILAKKKNVGGNDM